MGTKFAPSYVNLVMRFFFFLEVKLYKVVEKTFGQNFEKYIIGK